METLINALATDPIGTLFYIGVIAMVIYAAIKIGGVLLKIGLTIAAIYLIYNFWATGIANDPHLNAEPTSTTAITQTIETPLAERHHQYKL